MVGLKMLNIILLLVLQDQEGAFRSGDLDYQRYNVRSNLDVKISNDLNMRVDMALL